MTTGRRALAETDLPKWWRKEMEALPAADEDKGEEELPLLRAMSLHKAWVSAAMWDLELPERLIDLYMGHKSPDLSPVTPASPAAETARGGRCGALAGGSKKFNEIEKMS